MWRKLLHLVLGIRRFCACRDLAKAETELGVLGWQQADFLTPESQEQARRIIDFEREEASLLNREAELSERMGEIERLKSAAGERAAAVVKELESAIAGFAAVRGDGKAGIAEKQKNVARFEKAIIELKQELAGLETVGGRLRAIHTSQAYEESARVAERCRGLSNEIEGLRRARTSQSAEVIDAEEKLALSKQRFETAQDELKQARRAADEDEREFSKQIAALERQRAEARKIAHALEEEKRSPFQVLGACLADSGVAPRNQPEAFDRVTAARTTVAGYEETIAELGRQSAQSDHRAIVQFYVIVVTALAALALIAAAMS